MAWQEENKKKITHYSDAEKLKKKLKKSLN